MESEYRALFSSFLFPPLLLSAKVAVATAAEGEGGEAVTVVGMEEGAMMIRHVALNTSSAGRNGGPWCTLLQWFSSPSFGQEQILSAVRKVVSERRKTYLPPPPPPFSVVGAIASCL